eukprot:scaffold140930_cov35-Tisochrysis_lutea.AAC.1
MVAECRAGATINARLLQQVQEGLIERVSYSVSTVSDRIRIHQDGEGDIRFAYVIGHLLMCGFKHADNDQPRILKHLRTVGRKRAGRGRDKHDDVIKPSTLQSPGWFTLRRQRRKEERAHARGARARAEQALLSRHAMARAG